jgi:hypothetical protein
MLHYVTINKIKVFYDESTNGGGRESLYAVNLLIDDKSKCNRVEAISSLMTFGT